MSWEATCLLSVPRPTIPVRAVARLTCACVRGLAGRRGTRTGDSHGSHARHVPIKRLGAVHKPQHVVRGAVAIDEAAAHHMTHLQPQGRGRGRRAPKQHHCNQSSTKHSMQTMHRSCCTSKMSARQVLCPRRLGSAPRDQGVDYHVRGGRQRGAQSLVDKRACDS
jgi:hypothetical protein